MKTSNALAVVLAACSTHSLAQTERDLDSHVHGQASLNVAIADSAVFIELNTPWDNLVGFEHAPRTDEQHARVDEALQQLGDPAKLFGLSGGDCSVEDVVLENSMSEDSHDDEHDGDHDAEHDDDHDAEHGDEHEGDHEDEHDGEHDAEHDAEHDDDHDAEHGDEHDGEASTHSVVLASYSFACNQIDELQSMELALFSIWSGFEELDVQLVGDMGQTLVELSPDQPVLDLNALK